MNVPLDYIDYLENTVEGHGDLMRLRNMYFDVLEECGVQFLEYDEVDDYGHMVSHIKDRWNYVPAIEMIETLEDEGVDFFEDRKSSYVY